MNQNLIPDFQEIFNTMPGYFLVLQANPPYYTILAISDEQLQITKQERQDVVGKSVFEVYPENPEATTPTGPSNLRISLQNTMNNKALDQMPVVRYDLINTEGVFEERYWKANNKPVLNSEGNVLYILHTSSEITEQVMAEKRATAMEIEKKHSLLMQAPVAFCIVKGPNNTVELANEELLKIVGRTPDIIGKPLFESIPEAINQGLPELLDQVRNTGRPFDAREFPLALEIGSKQEVRQYSFVCQPYYEDPSDMEAAGVFSVWHDVTDQVLARRKVEESEQQVRSFIESSHHQIGVYFGREMRIQFANQALKDGLGKGNDILGKLYKDVLPELENQQVFEQLEAVYTTGIPFQAKNHRLDLVVDGELKTHFFDLSLTPLYNTAGEVYGVINTGADVTELIHARERVAESESHFRDMIKQAPVAIALTRGHDMVFESVNAPMLQIMGRKTAEEVTGKKLVEALPEVKDHPVLEIVREVLETGKSLTGDEVAVNLLTNGKVEERYLNLSYTPLKEDGLVTGVIHVAFDVTAQVLARKKIEVEKERAKMAIEAGELGVFEINLKTNEIISDERFDQIFGFDRSQDIAQYEAAIYPDDLPIREAAIKEGLQNGTLDYESRIIDQQGRVRWIKRRGRFYFDEAGKPSKIIGMVQDLTAQKSYAEELKKFKVISDYAFDAFILMREDGTFAYLNDLALKRWGYTKEEALYIRVPDVDPIYQEEEFNQIFALAQKQNIPPFETLHKSKDGTVYPVEVSMGGVTLEGKPHMFAVARDITERKLAEETLKIRNQELQKINNDLDNFIYTASHDLKAPISNIEGLLALLSIELSAENIHEDETKQILKMMQSSVDRFKNTIESLTDIVKLQQANKIEATLVNLPEIIEDVRLDLEPMIKAAHAIVEVDVVDCDSIRFTKKNLRSIIYNLLSNAIKYRSSERVPQIQISCSATAEYHILSVVDNGLGIESNRIGELFTMFRRFHDHVEGTGIGLYMVKKMVENASGHIEVESNVNESTTFRVFFPR